MESDTETPAPAKKRKTPVAGREDCWSEARTEALIEAWGERFVALNRGSLRQRHWEEVAEAVNSDRSLPRRTDVQCKNRIDTLKKKYKIEKSFNRSSWPFFSRLDSLFAAGGSRRPPSWSLSSPFVPVGRRSLTHRRPAETPTPIPIPAPSPERSMSAFLAAVAAIEEEEEEATERRGGGKVGELAEAIEKLGETYERVERAKQKQMVELEKQRMQFAKDLEAQRMQLFMETQLHIQSLKRSKRDDYA